MLVDWVVRPGAGDVGLFHRSHGHADRINRYIPAETEIIAFLVESFNICYRTSTQYRVGQYRVDLYFHSPSIIV